MGFVPLLKSLILFLYFRSCIMEYYHMMEDVVISTEDGPQLMLCLVPEIGKKFRESW
jgi:hypothetical protein